MVIRAEKLFSLRLKLGACAAKVVELNIEPVVNLLVLFVVFGANLFAREAFLESFGLGGSAILVSAAQVQGVEALDTAIPANTSCKVIVISVVTQIKIHGARLLLGIDVSAQSASNDVAEMRYVVDIWQSRCDQHVLLAGLGKTFWAKTIRLLEESWKSLNWPNRVNSHWVAYLGGAEQIAYGRVVPNVERAVYFLVSDVEVQISEGVRQIGDWFVGSCSHSGCVKIQAGELFFSKTAR